MPCDTHTTHSPPSPFSVIVARGISVLFPLVEVLTLLVSLMTFVCTDLWFSFAPGAISPRTARNGPSRKRIEAKPVNTLAKKAQYLDLFTTRKVQMRSGQTSSFWTSICVLILFVVYEATSFYTTDNKDERMEP